MKSDYYQLLDLRSNATAAEIKKKFRELAKQYHPDRNPGNGDAEECFKLINEAYEHLRDPDKRAEYDRYLNRLQHKEEPRRAHAWYDEFHPVDRDLRDFFKGFYGARNAGRRRAAPGSDVRFNLKVAFEEAALGCVKDIRFPIFVDCPRCAGSGIPAGARQHRCADCRGTGRKAACSGFGRQCEPCRGTGRVYLDRCRRCSGSGQVRSYRSIQVNVPPGIETGTRLHLKGLGARGAAGGRPGDFFVVVHVVKHPMLEIEDGILVCRVPVPVYRALAGCSIEVPTLDGSAVIDLPPGAQSGQELRLRGQGLRSAEKSRRGDLVIRLAVEMPKKMTPAEKKLLKQLAGTAQAGAYPAAQKYARTLAGLCRKKGRSKPAQPGQG